MLMKDPENKVWTQWLIIKGVFTSLPILDIPSAIRGNQADIKVAVLDIPSVASGIESTTLYEKIDFVMTFKISVVKKMVSEKLQTENSLHRSCNQWCGDRHCQGGTWYVTPESGTCFKTVTYLGFAHRLIKHKWPRQEWMLTTLRLPQFIIWIHNM